jgi:hypothetical protein
MDYIVRPCPKKTKEGGREEGRERRKRKEAEHGSALWI